MRTEIEIDFGDGRYTFRLTLPLVHELQKKTGIGLGGLFARILAGRYVDKENNTFGFPGEAKWAIDDLIETIRLGLMGGGRGVNGSGEPVMVDMKRANELVAAYVYPARPLKEAWDLTTAILTGAVEGMEETNEHPVKKKSARTATQKATSIIN